jgi:lipopolysaccharide heptosyltransferase II
MDILIVKLGALGDVVNTLPLAIRLKKHFSSRIHWVVEPLSLPLVSRHPQVDRTILLDRAALRRSLPRVVSQIREQRFDMVLDLQRIAKSALLCMAASADRRLGFDAARCKEMTWLMPFERIAPSDPGRHMVEQYMDFARHLGVDPLPVEWNLPQGDPLPAGLPGDYLVLNIGATKPANRWSAEGFARLAGLVAQTHRMPCVLTGSGQDKLMARQIASLAGEHVVDLVGRTTIPQLIGVLSGAAAVVSCDTGPMHLAVALGKEVIALFGPADPKRTGPYRGRVVRASLPCMPCNRRRCENPLCMEAITPREVLENIGAVL